MDKVKETVNYWCDDTRNELCTGKGVGVAVLDTGIARHPDLLGKLVCFHDFVGNRKLMYDDNGHGTHVCGILCSSGGMSGGKYRGIASDVKLVVGKVLDERGDGSTESMLEGLKWVLSVREKYQIRVLNISVGIGNLVWKEKEEALKQQIEAVWDSGIVVVCAAGNKGPADGSISSVGGSRKVITVGCHDGSFCKENQKRCETYSGRGGLDTPVRKPDIVAPGTDIISCNGCCRRLHGKVLDPYVAKSGTSMATPIVSGAAALALQKFSNLTNEELKEKMTLTATDLGEPWNKQGWGMLHVKRLLKSY